MKTPHHKRPFRESFRSAFKGILFASRREKHIRVHFIIASFVVLLALILSFMGLVDALELAVLFVAISVVLVAEMINTVIEILVAALVKEHHPEVGQALDICAGAVLVASFLAAVVGVLILGLELWKLLREFGF